MKVYKLKVGNMKFVVSSKYESWKFDFKKVCFLKVCKLNISNMKFVS